MKRNRLLSLSLISGVLLALPWFEYFSGIILLIAFVPLLFIEDYLYINTKKNRPYLSLGYSFLTFLVWNILATFWIGKISLGGAAVVIISNAFLLSLVFFLFHLTKRNLGRNFGTFSLMVYWIGWEYLFMNAEITWPWLNLGNGFAKDVSLIQWYEYTGLLGGTLWVLVINLVLFNILKFYIVHKSFKAQLGQVIFFLVLLFLPVTVSIIAFNSYEAKENPVKIGILQPNIDPYEEKFEKLSGKEQGDILLSLTNDVAEDKMDYILGPETAIDSVDIAELSSESVIREFSDWVNNYPSTHIVMGVDGYQIKSDVSEGKRAGETISQKRYIYNSAVQIDTSGHYPLYHKSRLVIGVEKTPYPRVLQFLNSFILDIGGTSGNRSVQEEREVFQHTHRKLKVAPVICYESVFGEYVSRYVRNGANLLFVITNDGWLRSPGYQQHMHFARIRAVETRRSIARSANTGISCFINQKGQIVKSTEWWTRDTLKGTIHASSEITFYVKYGDYIGRIAAFLGVFALLYLVAKMLMKSTKNVDLLKLRE